MVMVPQGRYHDAAGHQGALRSLDLCDLSPLSLHNSDDFKIKADLRLLSDIAGSSSPHSFHPFR